MNSNKYKFCDNCDNYLKLVENDNNLYYSCTKCTDSPLILIENVCIFSKKYKNTDFRSIEIDNLVKNKYLLEDPCLPRNKSKCPKCKKINQNSYFVKYIDMKFNIINICSNCKHNFF